MLRIQGIQAQGKRSAGTILYLSPKKTATLSTPWLREQSQLESASKSPYGGLQHSRPSTYITPIVQLKFSIFLTSQGVPADESYT